ncbi:MAG: aminotransferase class IV [Candidatus Sumerlaeia bacterium]|nr:aminotransferase class IV [Candidatus Sumerlaeia bacterium]
MIVYLNGVFKPLLEASLDPTDRGFLLGESVFETIRVEQAQPLEYEAHTRRLQASAAWLGVRCPGAAELLEVIQQTVDANGLAAARVRITLSPGSEPGGAPTLLVAALPIDDALLDRQRMAGWHALTVQEPVNERSSLRRHKCGSYLEQVRARRLAQANGADEALLLNTLGRVAECAMANLFAVLEGDLIATPPVEEGALPGVMRRRVLALADELGLDSAEVPLTPEDLRKAQELFATNVMIQVQPIVTLDGAAVGSGGPGSLTRQLFRAHRADVDRYLFEVRRG